MVCVEKCKSHHGCCVNFFFIEGGRVTVSIHVCKEKIVLMVMKVVECGRKLHFILIRID